MKILVPLCLLFSIFSTNAFATHAYRFEDCSSSTHNLAYTGNYPLGGLYEFQKKDSENQVKTLPLRETDADPDYTLEDASLLFDTISTKEISRDPVTSGCGFETESWKSEKTIQVAQISPEASQILGLKAGDKMTFICEESFDYPDQSDCKK